MKDSLIFSLLLLSIFFYEAQGIRLKELSTSASYNQESITKSSWESKDDGSAVTSVVSSGRNRKLMTKTISSSPTTINEKNDQKANKSFAHEALTKEGIISPTTLVPKNSKHEKIEVSSELSPDAINDIAGMDYSPAKRKPPIHN
uniref:uncharacterized protein LOC122599883 n=1 Tax=Erigeron canadensis TaxID=72917 RepID=UPI001CB93E73|nr:uncharacterized protein LOC122599883 [Erigeron canadensis]